MSHLDRENSDLSDPELEIERLKEAVALYEQAFDDTGIDYSHLVCLQKARELLDSTVEPK